MTPTEAANDYLRKYSIENPGDAFIAAKASAMVTIYLELHQDDAQLEIVAAEEWYELDVINPDSGRMRKEKYTHAGYLDGICAGEFQGRTGRFILERKTTDQDIAGDSSYWNRLRLNHQLDEYALAYWQKNGTTVDGVIYDVLRQPGISPRKITLAELTEMSEAKTYFGRTVRDADQDRASRFLSEKETYANAKKEHAKEAKKNNAESDLAPFIAEQPEQPTESPSLFRVRCLAYLEEKKGEYFAQKFVPKTEPEILDYARELWTLSDLIRSCQTIDSSPRNPSACFNFMSSCEYVGVCSGIDSTDSAKWDHKPEVNQTRLSQSRIACYQTCRRKHYYRHVAGVLPVARPASEKQTLGQLVHKALEISWRAQQQPTS